MPREYRGMSQGKGYCEVGIPQGVQAEMLVRRNTSLQRGAKKRIALKKKKGEKKIPIHFRRKWNWSGNG